jgi:cellobiose dehydrogenase (acceptor)
VLGGIGPEDQLRVVASSKDGADFIDEKDWIKLPVGYNLIDHLNTDLILTQPDVVFYDFYEAWTTPIEADKQLYLEQRSGILAQAAPNIGPMVS